MKSAKLISNNTHVKAEIKLKNMQNFILDLQTYLSINDNQWLS